MNESLNMQILLNDEKTRELLTEILIDLIKTRKELFAEIFLAVNNSLMEK
jgi:hypothetical protein